MATLILPTSASNLLQLRNVVVYRNLSHPLNLGLDFFRQFKAKLDYEGDQPRVNIHGESYLLVANMTQVAGGGPDPPERRVRDQL